MKPLIAVILGYWVATASAELAEVSDSTLAGISAQAGIDIKLAFEADIEKITYTDTPHNGDNHGGGLTINDIHIGGGQGRLTTLGIDGSSNSSQLDNFMLSIDIDDAGSMTIDGMPTDGGVGLVDFHVSTGAIHTVDLNGNKAVSLFDSINMWGGIGFFRMYLSPEHQMIAGQTVNYTNVRIVTEFGIDELDIDASEALGIRIDNAVIAGKDYFEQISEDGSPTLTARMATLRTNIYPRFDPATATPNGIIIDLRTISDSTNVFDIDLPSVVIGGDPIGQISLNDLDLRGVSFEISGHQ